MDAPESCTVTGLAIHLEDQLDRVEQMLLAGRPSAVALPEAGASAGGRQLVALGLMGPRRVSVPAPRPASEDLVALAAAVGVLA